MEPNFTQYTPKGIEILVYTDKPYTAEELIQIDIECEKDCEEQNYWEDPNADGYGWERKALLGAG